MQTRAPHQFVEGDEDEGVVHWHRQLNVAKMTWTFEAVEIAGCTPFLVVHGAEGRVVQAAFDWIFHVVEDDWRRDLFHTNLLDLQWELGG